MNCPQCDEKARCLPGGSLVGISHSTRYYICIHCKCRFKAVGPVVQIMNDELQTFKSSREAARALRLAVTDEIEWFKEVDKEICDRITDETRELARQVLPVLLKKIKAPRKKKPTFNLRTYKKA